MTDEPSYEDLPQPRPRRAGRLLLTGLVLAGLGATVVRLAHSPGGDPGAVHPSVPGPARTTVPVTQPGLDPPLARALPACPSADDGQVACTSYPGLAASTARALRERFPGVVVVYAVTQMLRDTGPEALAGLWSRHIIARAGALRLRIAISRAEPRDRATTGVRQGRHRQLIRYIRGPYLIEFELRGPVDPHSLPRTIAWLRTESRLVHPVYRAGGTMVR